LYKRGREVNETSHRQWSPVKRGKGKVSGVAVGIWRGRRNFVRKKSQSQGGRGSLIAAQSRSTATSSQATGIQGIRLKPGTGEKMPHNEPRGQEVVISGDDDI